MKRLTNKWTYIDACIERESNWSASDNDGLIVNVPVCVAPENLASSVNLLMHVFSWGKKWSLILILPPLLYPSIQMGTARDERISLYWTWLNAELMKAYADNSFFIMSLARLGISFSFAEKLGFPLSLLLWMVAVAFGWIVDFELDFFLNCIFAW